MDECIFEAVDCFSKALYLNAFSIRKIVKLSYFFSLRHAGGREFMMIYIIISYFCYHIFSSSFAVLKPTPIYLMDINALNNQIVEKITYLFKYEFLYTVRPILKLHGKVPMFFSI